MLLRNGGGNVGHLALRWADVLVAITGRSWLRVGQKRGDKRKIRPIPSSGRSGDVAFIPKT